MRNSVEFVNFNMTTEQARSSVHARLREAGFESRDTRRMAATRAIAVRAESDGDAARIVDIVQTVDPAAKELPRSVPTR